MYTEIVKKKKNQYKCNSTAYLIYSLVYYFNNYLSHNKILQLLNYLLCEAIRIANYPANKYMGLLKK